MRKSLNKGCVIGFAVAVFALLAIAPRPSSADGDPALANQDQPGANGKTLQGNQAYDKAYNKAYNDAYAAKQQQLDNSSSNQGSGGCCGGGSGGG